VATIADRKLAGSEWIDVHRVAHGLGIRTNCTMLYWARRDGRGPHHHLGMLRDLQDETGGFLAYIPLAYHPDNNELGVGARAPGHGDDGVDDLKNLAVGRLFLDNFDHVKSHWIMVTPPLSQLSLHFGVNDLEGTVVREKIYHEAGAHTAQAMSSGRACCASSRRGKIPAERDSFNNVIRSFDDDPTRAAA
jgi:aminodeoxyfutalosine synthase